MPTPKTAPLTGRRPDGFGLFTYTMVSVILLAQLGFAAFFLLIQ